MTVRKDPSATAIPAARRVRTVFRTLTLCVLLFATPTGAKAQTSDSERLGMAIDYFQNGKYHEALLILENLDKHYRLNPRFRAYLGVCYYYEWDYRHATECLAAVIPKLEKFSPHERSFYLFANAESLFNLQQYDKALDNYGQMLALCHDNEKGDAYYKIGLIHTFRNGWIDALDNLQSAWYYYSQYTPDRKARIAQIRNMIQGCCDKINANGTH